MKMINVKIAALLTGLTLGMTPSHAAKDLKICTPHKLIIQDLESELSSLGSNNFEARIDHLEREISSRQSKINSLDKSIGNARAHKRNLEQRLKLLTHSMDKVVAQLNQKIKEGKKQETQGKADLAHNEKKKSECKSGLRGTFCRKKYRSRIKDAKRDIEAAKNKQAQAAKKKAGLPTEKKALPGKIAQAKNKMQDLESQLSDVMAMKPSISQMENRIDKLISQGQQAQQQRVVLQDQIAQAEEALNSCQKMVKKGKAYPIMKAQVKAFLNEPTLCDSMESLMSYADKPFKKMALKDAYAIACSNQMSDSIDEEPQSQVIKLNKVISSPVGYRGHYQNNFREGDEAKMVDSVGQEGVQSIKFSVSFDIEANYDFLLIKDAEGNVVEKIDGQGTMEVEVESSFVDILFFSDGRTGGEGFKISNIELTK